MKVAPLHLVKSLHSYIKAKNNNRILCGWKILGVRVGNYIFSIKCMCEIKKKCTKRENILLNIVHRGIHPEIQPK